MDSIVVSAPHARKPSGCPNSPKKRIKIKSSIANQRQKPRQMNRSKKVKSRVAFLFGFKIHVKSSWSSSPQASLHHFNFPRPLERGKRNDTPSLPPQGAAIQRFQKLGTTGKRLSRLRIGDPLTLPLVHLGPLVLFPVHCDLEELV